MPIRTPHRRRLAGTVVAVAATALLASLVVAGSALAAPHPAASHPVDHVAAPCANGQTVSWLNTAGNGYAGGVGYELEFTNVSTHACSLFGFPGVSAVTRAGHELGSPAPRDGSATHTVTIPAGRLARATVQLTDTANFPPSACRPVTAFGLRVYAPGQSASDVIPFPFSVCAAHSPTSISIRAVT